MGQRTSLPWLLALAGCAATDAAPPPMVAPEAPPAVTVTPLASPAAAAQRSGYVQEVDDLFRALAAQDARQGRAAGGAAGLTSPATRAAYDENLAICLDGRWFAFCDHELLTVADAARVRSAEYHVNQVTCIDSQWQYLCRPELLPDVTEAP